MELYLFAEGGHSQFKKRKYYHVQPQHEGIAIAKQQGKAVRKRIESPHYERVIMKRHSSRNHNSKGY